MLGKRQDGLIELFRRKNFKPLCTKSGATHLKQLQALELLTDDLTRELAYGGAAGGAKSWTGCTWLMFSCLAFPDTRYFIGREELKRLRESTLITFFKVAKEYDISGWKYNGQDHYIKFDNGSRIDLLELKYLPSDPLYERYGSVEYTSGWVEEGGEINIGAYDTLKSRIGRQNNEKYNLIPKLFTTLNPKKNWCYHTFWKPFKAGTLPDHIKFLQAFVQDNPFIDPSYIETLSNITDKVRKERLLYGNFDYDDDPSALIGYDEILNCFTNSFVAHGQKYITADIARFGSDKTVIGIWSGFRVMAKTYKGYSIQQVADEIKALQKAHSVPNGNTIADEDGVGGGVVDILGCKGFVNNSKALPNPITKEDDNYANLKSQCYFKLAERINGNGVYIYEVSAEEKDLIIQELEQVKQYEMDKDKKKQILPKEKVKEIIGRSPDYSDMLMMREWFELEVKKSPGKFVFR